MRLIRQGVAGGDFGGEPGDDRIDLVHAVAPGGGVHAQVIDIGHGEFADGNVDQGRGNPITGVVRKARIRPSVGREENHGGDDRDAEQSEEDDHGHHGAMTEPTTPSGRPEDGSVSGSPSEPGRGRSAGAVTGHGSSLVLGGRTFAPRERLIMAIINRTPDSFYDAGATFADESALAAADAALEAGADILDIGGVKAGPGVEVDPQEEIARTAGFIAALHERHPEAIISVDTWRASVGRAACEAGATLINDAWGGIEPELAEVAAHFGVGIVCTHAGGQRPRTRPHRVSYPDVMADVLTRVLALADRAESLGVARESIIIDPGHDFGMNTRHSLEATRRLDEMVVTGWPVLVSLSRKDFVGETLDIPIPAERLTGTLAATAISAWLGARIFRVHDVAATRQTLDMVDSIAGIRPPAVSRRGLA